jgi:hypothetical protein
MKAFAETNRFRKVGISHLRTLAKVHPMSGYTSAPMAAPSDSRSLRQPPRADRHIVKRSGLFVASVRRPRAGRLRPLASGRSPAASRLPRHASRLGPVASGLTPPAPRITSRAGRQRPHASRATHRASGRSPQAACLTPQAGRLTPLADRLAPRLSASPHRAGGYQASMHLNASRWCV